MRISKYNIQYPGATLWPPHVNGRNERDWKMSVTVKSLLKLPSLANARVVAGAGGLDKIVSTVSVLETMDYQLVDEQALGNKAFTGGEIVITGFVNGAEDVKAQYNLIKNLSSIGEVGLIVYYVGIFVKKIDPEIIKLADDLNFPIISMPENQINLRYGEAINDIMGLIVRDQFSGEPMIVNLLESISKLSPRQQTVDTMMRLISNRLRASVVLTTESGRTLYEAAWPSELAGIHQQVEQFAEAEMGAEPLDFPGMDEARIYRREVHVSGTNYKLYIVNVGQEMPQINLQQAVEGVRIAMKLWGSSEGTGIASEIIDAILTDQPLKMRSLSSMFELDIASVDSMWIFTGGDLGPEEVRSVAAEADKFCNTVCTDTYKERIILFTDTIRKKADVDALRTNLSAVLPHGVKMCYYTGFRNTRDVRRAYLLNGENYDSALKILPGRDFFMRGDMEFAGKCREIVEKGNESVEGHLRVLRVIDETDSNDLIPTLCIYLLDTDRNVQKTADKLFVHKNTVKYRINTISDRLGFHAGSMPESMNLYIACGIRRLLL